VVIGPAGAGKSSLLVLLALEKAMRAEDVLHIAVFRGEGPARLIPRNAAQHVRDQYDSILEGTLHGLKPTERADALLSVERHRLIHIAQGEFSGTGLCRLIDVLHEALVFEPKLIVVDGWVPAEAEITLLQEKLPSLAIWCVGTENLAMPTQASVVVEFQPARHHAVLVPQKIRDQSELAPVKWEPGLSTPSLLPDPPPTIHTTPEVCTLFSGGAAGAEACFGQAAERWGIREVNFTFDGHVQAHTRGAHPLTESELAQGDVSLAYVARRLRRTLSEKTILRRVLQSLWHQVSRSEQIFVIGTIQEDGTVTGGTGWSVELARMWGKRVWVFDQEKECWYRWNGDDWVAGKPVIDALSFCGTGTRQLTDTAIAEVDALFTRSFGPSV
jgi:hypothetical protein